jgi:hypothetical protein
MAAPVPSELFEHNGAGLCWVPLLRKYAVVDSIGQFHGYRVQLAAARELARSLPGVPHDEPEPAPVSRSPHALPLAEVQDMPSVMRRDERVDFFEERAPTVVSAFEGSRALCRRQAAAHDKIYRRHARGR